MPETDESQETTYNYASGCDDISNEELGLAVLPRHTKVLVTDNNRTKSVLLELHGVVKQAYQSVGDRQQSHKISAVGTPRCGEEGTETQCLALGWYY
jgi:hypothetical protein